MCRRIECPHCKKPTYAGCGMHIEQVLGDVPTSERCRCKEKPERAGEGTGDASIWQRIFGR